MNTVKYMFVSVNAHDAAEYYCKAKNLGVCMYECMSVWMDLLVSQHVHSPMVVYVPTVHGFSFVGELSLLVIRACGLYSRHH